MNVIKAIISVLIFPTVLAISLIALLVITQIALHEALWENKES